MSHHALVNRLSSNAARLGAKLAPICVCAMVSALGPIVHADPGVYLAPQTVVGDQASNAVALTVSSFTVSPTTVVGGFSGTATGRVKISGAAPTGGQAVTLTVPTADAALVSAPAIVTVPEGLNSATFAISTTAVASPVAVSLTASIGTSTAEATLTVVNPGGNSYSGNLQFFSVPYKYNDLLADIFVTEPTSLEIAAWDPTNDLYDYQSDPSNVKIFPGIGYWAVFPSLGTSLLYLGTPASSTLSTTVTLDTGWNAIGDPYAVPYNIADLTFTTNNYTFAQATSPTFNLISPILYFFLQDPTGLSGSYGPITTGSALFPGVGYWIYSFFPTTVTFTPPGLPAVTTTTTPSTTTFVLRRRH